MMMPPLMIDISFLRHLHLRHLRHYLIFIADITLIDGLLFAALLVTADVADYACHLLRFLLCRFDDYAAFISIFAFLSDYFIELFHYLFCCMLTLMPLLMIADY